MKRKLLKRKVKAHTDYLTPLLESYPAGWAIIRANEIRSLDEVEFNPPVLDVGCGDGSVAKIILSSRGGKFDWGVDLSEREVKKAKISGSYKNCQVASVYKLPFKGRSFNTVFSNSVIEHIPNLDQAVQEMSRVLKPGGQFIITVPSRYITGHLLGVKTFKVLKLDFLAKLYGDLFNKLFKHLNLYDHNKWSKILSKHSLKLIKYKYYHTGGMIKIHELLSYIALPVHIAKVLIGRWVVFAPVRKVLILPWLKPLLKTFYLADVTDNRGGSLLLVAKKAK